jgi:hypothetical protein
VKRSDRLDLKAGEWVEVRSRTEIVATLDEHGRLDELPFMPEMLQYCGRRLRVSRRADKTCDYIQAWSIRRMTDTVHLEGVRCDGSGHGECQAGCLIFWKEAWLNRVDGSIIRLEDGTDASRSSTQCGNEGMVGNIFAASHVTDAAGETVYSCQGTDVPKYTSPMKGWDPRQYIRDLRSGNLATGLAGDSRSGRALEFILEVLTVLRALIISVFNRVQAKRHGAPYPFIEGTATNTSIDLLHLQAGEVVQVRTKEEIMATLDHKQRNRGLWFDSEMLPYCGGIYRVLRPVHQIIDEKTGKMIKMKNPCIILEGVVCRSDFHRLCPRAIYPYWRENWLRRANDASVVSVKEISGSCTAFR